MDDLLCPKCKQRFLREHSTIKYDKNGNIACINYEWKCCWCGFCEGDYNSIDEAKKDYMIKYGEENYGKQ